MRFYGINFVAHQIVFFNQSILHNLQRRVKLWSHAHVHDVFAFYPCAQVRSIALGVHSSCIHFGNYAMTLIIIYKMMKMVIWWKWQTKSCSCIIGRHKSNRAIEMEREALSWHSCQEYLSFVINFFHDRFSANIHFKWNAECISSSGV